MNRTAGLVEPGWLRWAEATVVLRVDHRGRNVGILVQTPDGARHAYLCEAHPTRLGAVALVEVPP